MAWRAAQQAETGVYKMTTSPELMRKYADMLAEDEDKSLGFGDDNTFQMALEFFEEGMKMKEVYAAIKQELTSNGYPFQEDKVKEIVIKAGKDARNWYK